MPSVETSKIRNVTGNANAHLDLTNLLKSRLCKVIANYILSVKCIYLRKLEEWIKPFVRIKNSHIISKMEFGKADKLNIDSCKIKQF